MGLGAAGGAAGRSSSGDSTPVALATLRGQRNKMGDKQRAEANKGELSQTK